MKKDLTEMVFILDRSGSMSGLEKDTIGGFNSIIEKQKQLHGEAIISTLLFDHEVLVLHDRVDLKNISLMDQNSYTVRGMTALLDAVGSSISHIRRVYAETLIEERPEKMVFVITTDGLENASKEYTYENVRRLIEEVKEKYGWEFIFLGANIDALSEAKKFGIDSDRAVRYMHDKVGTKKTYSAINEAIHSMRMKNVIKDNWKKDVDDDYINRKTKK